MPQPSSTEAHCLYCGRPLGFGRPDRKFCSAGCRHNYHNQQRADDLSETKKIQAVLKKNHKSLKGLIGYNEGVTVTGDEMLRAGYNFDYHTHLHSTTNDTVHYVFCYNYGYRKREGNEYRIVNSFKV